MHQQSAETLGRLIDKAIWLIAIKAGAKELDFLRAIHDGRTLANLHAYLSVLNPSASLRISSLWLDKFPICKPRGTSQSNSGSARELGDLGILVRTMNLPNTDECYMRFWILQGKLNQVGWQMKGSSQKEIDLYENLPSFDLFSSAQQGSRALGTFDLASDPFAGGNLAGSVWSYLLFDTPTKALGHQSSSPLEHIWPSTHPSSIAFSLGLHRMIQEVKTSRPLYGGRVDHQTPLTQWRNLFLALWNHTGRHTATGRLAGGTWQKTFPVQATTPLGFGGGSTLLASSTHILGPTQKRWTQFDQLLAKNNNGNLPPSRIDSDRVEERFSGLSWLVIDMDNTPN